MFLYDKYRASDTLLGLGHWTLGFKYMNRSNINEKVRYLITGAWNTLVGYLIFALLFALFSGQMNYMVIMLISNVFSITNAYVSYKFFVFKTPGNYLKEYMRFYVVYGASIVLNIILLPIFVEIFHIHPLISQAIIMTVAIISSYIGHKNFSFRRN
jgi:putative flippase GtrA